MDRAEIFTYMLLVQYIVSACLILSKPAAWQGIITMLGATFIVVCIFMIGYNSMVGGIVLCNSLGTASLFRSQFRTDIRRPKLRNRQLYVGTFLIMLFPSLFYLSLQFQLPGLLWLLAHAALCLVAALKKATIN